MLSFHHSLVTMVNSHSCFLTGEINHWKQKSESQARDLQKHIKDSAAALTEFEKALVRKSEECNVSYAIFDFVFVLFDLWSSARRSLYLRCLSYVSWEFTCRVTFPHVLCV